jgi:hypothetical protein
VLVQANGLFEQARVVPNASDQIESIATVEDASGYRRPDTASRMGAGCFRSRIRPLFDGSVGSATPQTSVVSSRPEITVFRAAADTTGVWHETQDNVRASKPEMTSRGFFA